MQRSYCVANIESCHYVVTIRGVISWNITQCTFGPLNVVTTTVRYSSLELNWQAWPARSFEHQAGLNLDDGNRVRSIMRVIGSSQFQSWLTTWMAGTRRRSSVGWRPGSRDRALSLTSRICQSPQLVFHISQFSYTIFIRYSSTVLDTLFYFTATLKAKINIHLCSP